MKSKKTFKTFILCLFTIFITNKTYSQINRFVDNSLGQDIGDCSDPDSPCGSISYALEQAESGDEIKIASGEYTEHFWISKSITLTGEDPETTIIQASTAPGEASAGVIYIEGGVEEVTISNLHIRHGVASNGGGIYNVGSFLTLSNVVLSENFARNSGGGLLTIYQGTSILNDVIFLNNTAGNESSSFAVGGGMHIESNCTIELTNVSFIGNHSFQGGGLNTQTDNLTLENVSFINNTADYYGGGMFSWTSPTLKNVVFEGNTATTGGGLANIFGSQMSLVNVRFYGNTAENGGAMSFTETANESNITLTNVTVSGNEAQGNGGGIYNSGEGAVTLTNSIVYGNLASEDGNEIYNDLNASTAVFNSIYGNDTNDIVEGVNFNTENSLTDNPLFADMENGNLRLLDGSPAINNGGSETNLSIFPGGPANPLDLDNNPRVLDDVIDIGAYEYQGSFFCPTPTNIVAENITATSADISWTEIGTATEWEIEYGEIGFTPGDGILIQDNDGEPGETIDGLQPATLYNVYVRAICEFSESEWVGPVTFSTEEAACLPPTDIALNNITTTSVDVSWTENGDATEWEIEYGEFGFSPGDGILIQDNDGEPGETIDGLQPATLYNVYVHSICDAGGSQWAGPVTFETEPTPCLPPTDITLNNITDTSVDVSWTENGDATEWEIEYGEFGFSPGDGILIQDNDGEPGETIDGLQPATLYNVYVHSICNSGGSQWAGPITFQTEPASCGSPSNIVVDVITPSMVYVTWTENGDATEWEIEYGETGFTPGDGTTIMDSDGIPGEAITGVEEGTDYDVYVRAVCAFSGSEWVGPVTFNTEEMGINEFKNQMILYPNPTTGIFNIQTAERINSVSIYNLAGQKMQISSMNKDHTSIDISNLSGGIYFVEIILNNKTIKSYRVIKR